MNPATPIRPTEAELAGMRAFDAAPDPAVAVKLLMERGWDGEEAAEAVAIIFAGAGDVATPTAEELAAEHAAKSRPTHYYHAITTMPLIHCPECNGQVSTVAEECPHCGATVKESEPTPKAYKALLLLGALAVMAGAGALLYAIQIENTALGKAAAWTIGAGIVWAILVQTVLWWHRG